MKKNLLCCLHTFIWLLLILFSLIGNTSIAHAIHRKAIRATTHHQLKSRKKWHHVSSRKKSFLLKKAAIKPIQPPVPPAYLPAYLLNTTEKRLVDFVQHTISSSRYSFYKLGGNIIDTKRGIFIVDCSTYVDHVMKSIYPRSYSNLVNWSGSQKPTSDDYYQYFINLTEKKFSAWNTVQNIDTLRPGDILVFRYKNIRGHETRGHVMIVMDKPIRDQNAFLVRVADSATAGHSDDTRRRHHSGIGMGTLLLKTNGKNLQPSAYAWKVGMRWQSNVNIAMARPLRNNLV